MKTCREIGRHVGRQAAGGTQECRFPACLLPAFLTIYLSIYVPTCMTASLPATLPYLKVIYLCLPGFLNIYLYIYIHD